jgi:hypothetical protein
MTDALLTDVAEARRRTIDAVRSIMHRDDALNGMVPSDLRLLIGEIDRLRQEVETFRRFADASLVQVVDAELR